MKYLNKIFLSSVLAMLLFMGNYSINSNNSDASLEFMGTKAVASVSGDCEVNGFKTWDAVNPLKPAGKDCWCEDRDKVKNECDISPE
ncbi:hypothetical protein [Gracilimonas sp.]|uniref:hypothetical protein n=1 Tax=Gracilimonas sp. TaxID=1974203 RepID=UPI00287137DD|nr:hypothetical protein [Gracilimonas sp.]